MAETSSHKPKAFVIMPFGEGFDEIYGLFIAGALAEAGYEVFRADDIRSHQNILKDILSGLSESTLIIADLTGSNPNVYYELGLAHALRKRVILLTQQVDELPFDLRSYRVIPYSTHFAEVAKAKSQLVTVAREALDDRVAFGSPVTDFMPRLESAPILPERRDMVTKATEGEPGVLDHLVDMEEGFTKLGVIVVSVSNEMGPITEASMTTVEQLAALAQANSPARERRAVVMALAAKLSNFAKSLSRHNDEYADTLGATRSSLEALIRAQGASTEDEKRQFQMLLSQLDQSETATRGNRAALGQVIEAIRSSPRIERTYNQAVDSAVRHLEGYAQNIDQTISMIVRARELAQTRLGPATG